MRRTAVALAALLSLAALPTALAAGHTLELSNATVSATDFEKFDAPAVGLGDFDGDGRVEIVAHNDNQIVYVLSSGETRVLAELRTDHPSGWGVRPISAPVVADVDGNGRLDIVATNSAAVTCRFEFDAAASSSTSFRFVKKWCQRADRYDGFGASVDGTPWVEDVDGDGRMEIFVQTEKVGYFAYRHDGTLLWSRDRSGGNAGPTVADLDGDGRKEVVFFGDAGEVRALDATTGSSKWSFHASQYVWPASIPVSGAIGDLDGDGRKEVVFFARQASHTDDYSKNRFMLFVLDHRGDLKWRAQPSWGNPMSYTHAVLHDVTGDGRKDILALDWNTIGHKPGNWERLGPANAFAYRHDGVLLWRTSINSAWSNDDIAVADFDGDGRLEVTVSGWDSSGQLGVWFLDARSGSSVRHVLAKGTENWGPNRGVFVADLDGDGRIEWGVPVHRSTAGGGFLIYDAAARCDGNVVYGGWQNHRPCSPPRAGSGTTPPPPPPSGDFTATFTTNGGNEWWVQVDVDASKSLAGVDARVDGGAWKALELKSWGDWAASMRAPEGSLVEFRARSTSGESVVSGTYRWTDGTRVEDGGGDDGSSPGTGFTATFTPRGGNEWWVQVGVKASSSLAGVDARVDGGSWKALELRSWGDWAGTVRAPEGSLVEFRARSTGGETAISAKYRWPEGTLADGSGGGTGFTATFTPRNGNEWWVQTKVEASAPLAGVDARVNGGAWNALELKSWGDWAASMRAPDGSTVEFRARSTGGETVVSRGYVWPQ